MLVEAFSYDSALKNPEKKKAELRAIERERYRKSVHTNNKDAAQFYRECIDAKITDMDKASDRERLVLFAKQKQISGTQKELIAAFNKGKIAAKAEEKEKRIADEEERINRLKENESKIRAENRAYLNYFGREKYIQICKDKIRACERIISEYEREAESVKRGGASFYQKERDWAIAGGIASGIAGGAAGVATAIDTQVQNVGIRANNQAIAGLTLNMLGPIHQKKSDAEKEKKRWEGRLSKAETRLVQERNESELFNQLAFELLEKSKSDTGSAIVKFKINQKTFNIYEDVVAVTDGSIKVLLNSDGRKVGEGIYVMREDLSDNPKVICDPINNQIKITESFNVEFVPNKLWAIEKI